MRSGVIRMCTGEGLGDCVILHSWASNTAVCYIIASIPYPIPISSLTHVSYLGARALYLRPVQFGLIPKLILQP